MPKEKNITLLKVNLHKAKKNFLHLDFATTGVSKCLFKPNPAILPKIDTKINPKRQYKNLGMKRKIPQMMFWKTSDQE